MDPGDFLPSDATLCASYRAGRKPKAERPWHLLNPDRENERSLCWADYDPATIQQGIATELACKPCLIQARRRAKEMPAEELAGLQAGDWVINMRTWTEHLVDFAPPGQEPAPMIHCSGELITALEPCRFRKVPEAKTSNRCLLCTKTRSARETPKIPEPLGKLGEPVEFGGVRGLYGRPIPWGHELRVNGRFRKVTINAAGETKVR